MDPSAQGGSGTSTSAAASHRIDPRQLSRAERDRRRLTSRVLGGALIVALAIVGVTAAMIWRLEQGQFAEGRENVSALDLLVGAQTERAFDNINVVLDGIAADLQVGGVASAAGLRQAAGGEASFRSLRAKMAGVPQLESVVIATSAGDVVNDTRSYPVVPDARLTDREYFVRLRDHPELAAYISPPLPNSDGKPTIYVGKRLNAPNGAFIGVVIGAVPVPYFSNLYANYLRALPGDHKSTALWRDDGTLLSRSPIEGDAAIDAMAPDFTRPMPRSGLLAYWATAPGGGRIAVAQRRFDGLPLAIEVRQSAPAIVGSWGGELLATGLGGGALLLLVGAAVWMLLRQLRAQALVSEERARANREAEARGDVERARMEAEAAMRDAQQSEARFRDIAEVGSDWIWETDAEHRFTMVAGARQPKVNILGKSRWELAGVDPATDPLWRDHKVTLDAHQPFRQFRFVLTLPSGRFHTCVSGKPIFADDGSFIGYRGTVSDETELVATRERAARADALLRNAIESIAEGFVIFDAEDRFVMCNEAYRKMYPENSTAFTPGASYEEIMRTAIATGRYPDAIGHEEEWLAEHIRQHKAACAHEENQLADGRWVLRSERRMPDGGIAGLRIDITALKRAQELLRDSEMILNRAQRLSATGSVVRNLKTGKAEWSDEMYRIFGVTRETFVPASETFRACIHPDDRARVIDTIAHGAESVGEAAIEFRILRPDGSVRWVYRETNFWCDPDGTPVQRLTIYKDITEQRAAERRHRELEIMLRDAIESISEGFVIYGADDRLVICNEGYRRLYPEVAHLIEPGVHFADILRAQLAHGHRPEVKDREEEWIAEMLRNRRMATGSQETQMVSGRWILVAERPMSNGGLAGLRVDITEMKQVQQSLRESEERFNRTQRIAHIGTVERDLRTREVIWTDETFRIFGVTRESYKPSFENLMSLVHPEDREVLVSAYRRNDRQHANTAVKFRIVRPNGDTRTIFSQADTVYAKDGTPTHVSIAMMDITDKEVSYQRQIELETQLRHSEKLTALGTLAGGIAHDINNTLVPIQALSKLVMKEFPPDAPAHGDLETIYQASIQARDLVRQILAFSRKEALLNEPTDIATRVQEALQMLRASVPSTIEIVERVATVPPILADGTQLHQVIVNLVANAAHAIGSECGRVTVSLDEIPGEPGTPHMIRLGIADNGCGMSPEIMQRMFEPFFTTKSVGEGTGLGLSVVHGIVTSHGGTIDVRSSPGEGSEFIILLPAKSIDDNGDVADVA